MSCTKSEELTKNNPAKSDELTKNNPANPSKKQNNSKSKQQSEDIEEQTNSPKEQRKNQIAKVRSTTALSPKASTSKDTHGKRKVSIVK